MAYYFVNKMSLMNMLRAVSIASVALFLVQCNACEERGTITFDNTGRLWCNCDLAFSNGDEYVVFAGESRTYEFWRGTHTITVDCGNDAYGNSLCGFEDGYRQFSVDVGCGDAHVIDLDF